MITPIKFKEAFKAYMAKPDAERNKLVEDSLRASSDFSERRKAEIKQKRDEVTTALDLQAKTEAAMQRVRHGEAGEADTMKDAEAITKIQLDLAALLPTQAVDTTIRCLTAQCPWTEYQDGTAVWRKLDNVVVRLGPPPGKPGWGAAINRIASDERVAVCDGNPLGVDVAVRSTLEPALATLQAALEKASMDQR